MAVAVAPQLDQPTFIPLRQPLGTIPGSNVLYSGHIDCSVCSKKIYISCQAKGHVIIILKDENLLGTSNTDNYREENASVFSQTLCPPTAPCYEGSNSDGEESFEEFNSLQNIGAQTIVNTGQNLDSNLKQEYEDMPSSNMKKTNNPATAVGGDANLKKKEKSNNNKVVRKPARKKTSGFKFKQSKVTPSDKNKKGRGHKIRRKKREERYHHCEMCNSNVKDPKAFSVHMRNHVEPKSHECDVCGKLFRQLFDLNKHKRRVHDGWRPYVCDDCGKTFASKAGLRNHKNIHLGIKSHVCHLCGKCFSFDSNLKRHLVYHSGEKRFSCDFCGKKFFQKIAKIAHQRMHTGEHPYRCEICGKGFKQATLLKRHLKNHERDESGDENKTGSGKRRGNHPTGEEVICELCGKTLSSKASLYSHTRFVHEKVQPYSCSVCFKLFSTSQGLNQHYITHTGEKPFACTVCGKKFNWQANCFRHMKLHTGERPFKCDICGKVFAQKSNMKAHLKTHDKQVHLQQL